jgi:23S rRNA (cytosine1962-C5)-methyltransferase
MAEGIVTIKKGREKPIIHQHPWIFSGAIERAQDASPGDIVTVVKHDGSFLARGYWNPKSQIQVRILTWHDEPIDDDWWRRMLLRAIAGREAYNYAHSNAYRIVNAENDFIPGLIVDRYADWLVLQALTLGIDQRKPMLAEIIHDLLKPNGIFERSDVDIRGKEGLKHETGLIVGEDPPPHIEIREHSIRLLVDVRQGHKTGFYLDQSENRFLLGEIFLDPRLGQRNFLNLFSYTGGFGLNAAHGIDDRVVNVDSSQEALNLARQNFELNPPTEERIDYIQADAFEYLRDAVARGEQFDIIVCDPPKFAHNAQQVERAARGYKDLNLNCFKLIKPGGYLMTFSCSGAVSADLFQKIVFGALADSGRQAQILKHLGPGDDHPVALTFPEGAYLKGLLLRVY